MSELFPPVSPSRARQVWVHITDPAEWKIGELITITTEGQTLGIGVVQQIDAERSTVLVDLPGDQPGEMS